MRSERKARQAADKQAAAWRILRYDRLRMGWNFDIVLYLVVSVSYNVNERTIERGEKLLCLDIIQDSFRRVERWELMSIGIIPRIMTR